MRTEALRLHALGELRLLRGERALALPPSRKTRALLAYLALTGRPHRRERLCELFWDVPDDPRGALRWSLSKLRPLLNEPDRVRILADRERVALALDPGEVDLLDIRRSLEAGTSGLPAERLRQAAEALAAPLLDGLDLPHLDGFQAWLTAQREAAQALRLATLAALAGDAALSPASALAWAREWRRSDPSSSAAAAALARALRAVGGEDEAEAVLRESRRNADAAPPGQAREDARALTGRQSIGFCCAPDGVRIAYASVGRGPPILKAANWLNHLELDWGSPIWSRTFAALSARRTLIRYDERGNGLSDWDVAEISFDAFVRDLEAVADAQGLDRFPLLGMSQGCAVSIAYAARRPERVAALILIGGYAAGWRIGASPEERERRKAVMTLTRLGWGTSNAAYRHIFSQTFMPDGTPEELAWFDEFQRQTTSPENAVRFQDAFGDIDVRHLLAQVRAPTLVLHARQDQRIAMAQGRELAIGIPGARFVALESRSHIILGHEPAWPVLMAEIERFLDGAGL